MITVPSSWEVKFEVENYSTEEKLHIQDLIYDELVQTEGAGTIVHVNQGELLLIDHDLVTMPKLLYIDRVVRAVSDRVLAIILKA